MKIANVQLNLEDLVAMMHLPQVNGEVEKYFHPLNLAIEWIIANLV
jgi:hypothetical protein